MRAGRGVVDLSLLRTFVLLFECVPLEVGSAATELPQ